MSKNLVAVKKYIFLIWLLVVSVTDINYNDFNIDFRYSKFISNIDSTDTSILSNDTNILLYKRINPALNSFQNIQFNFDIPLSLNITNLNTTYDINDQVTVYSSEYILDGERVRIHDDGNGNLRVVKLIGTNYSIVLPNIGTVNYDTGQLNLINFKIDAYFGNSFKLFVLPREKDFKLNKNVILSLETSEIDIDVTQIINSME